MSVDEAKQLLAEAGYVVLREKSYRAAQERQRIAQCMEEMERDRREGVEKWARDCCQEERRIRDRLTFVYGVARAFGASVADLSGDTTGGDE
jgi:hypothetical protein